MKKLLLSLILVLSCSSINTSNIKTTDEKASSKNEMASINRSMNEQNYYQEKLQDYEESKERIKKLQEKLKELKEIGDQIANLQVFLLVASAFLFGVTLSSW
jgi:flagellar motility protein MotE (MotC chaperone)